MDLDRFHRRGDSWSCRGVGNGRDTPGFWTLFGAVVAAFVVETMTDFALGSVAPLIRGTNTITGVSGPLALLCSRVCRSTRRWLLSWPTRTRRSRHGAWRCLPFLQLPRRGCCCFIAQQRETAEALGDANARLGNANLSFATALVATLDARDRYTAGHSAAVAIYARDIAKRMGLSEHEQKLVHLCGLVHDIGKIGLPAGLLEKPGALIARGAAADGAALDDR